MRSKIMTMKLELKNKRGVHSLAVSPDGKWLAVGNLGNMKGEPCLSIWDTGSWECVAEAETDVNRHITSISFNQHSDTLAYVIATGNSTIRFFDLKMMKVKRGGIKADVTTSVCYARSKDLLLVTGQVAKVLDADNEAVWTYDGYKAGKAINKQEAALLKDFINPEEEDVGYTKEPAAAVFCNDDTAVMITGNLDRKFSVFDIQTGKLTEQFPGGVFQAASMATDPAEKYVYLIARIPDASLLWSRKKMKKVLPELLNENFDGLPSVGFHPSSKFFATGSHGGDVSFRDIKEGKFLFDKNLHKGTVYAIAFTKDGKLLISGGKDGQVLLTDITKYL